MLSGVLKLAVVALPMLAGAMVDEDKIADGPREAIRGMCAERWSTNYDMQVFCQQKQSTAYWKWVYAGGFVQKMKANAKPTPYDTAFMRSFDGCTEKWWGRKNQPNFDMIVFCLLKQMSAYEQLSK